MRTGLAGESACPTLTHKDLRLGGAGAFACEPIFSQALTRGAALPWSVVTIDEQLNYLRKGLAELIREDELRERLIQSEKTGRPLRIKAGFDPTAPDLHLGHTVLLRKMKHFQDLGHTVIFLIGDMTGLIGDPTGRNTTRPPMTREEINRNAETYKTQVFKILDPHKTEIRFNSEWMEPLKFEDVIKLCSKYTVARLLERDYFANRLKEGISISVHELLYPFVQAYDSVALHSDVEMGGTDQKFNLLVAREIQRDFGQAPQIIATVPVLEGLDGIEKMSKSKGNYIGITEPPKVMFRKVMGISDDLMWRYWELLTDKGLADISAMKTEEPMQVKMRLARQVVGDFHSVEDAAQAQTDFDREVRSGQEPDDIETISIPPDAGSNLAKILVAAGLADSRTDAERKIKAGAVEIDGEKHSGMTIGLPPGTHVFRVGKKWKRIQIP
ncbi:MAG: tyrosine--tRNA ligase [Bryobacteraceae bacterium]|jgi:tyrosyl-tRNA synthetase